jgi:hypothetical protein
MNILFFYESGMILAGLMFWYKTTVYTRLITGLCTVWVGNLQGVDLGFVYNLA